MTAPSAPREQDDRRRVDSIRNPLLRKMVKFSGSLVLISAAAWPDHTNNLQTALAGAIGGAWIVWELVND